MKTTAGENLIILLIKLSVLLSKPAEFVPITVNTLFVDLLSVLRDFLFGGFKSGLALQTSLFEGVGGISLGLKKGTFLSQTHANIYSQTYYICFEICRGVSLHEHFCTSGRKSSVHDSNRCIICLCCFF